MEKSKNEENSLAKVLLAQSELLEKLTARVEQLTPPTSTEHEEVIRTHHMKYTKSVTKIYITKYTKE